MVLGDPCQRVIWPTPQVEDQCFKTSGNNLQWFHMCTAVTSPTQATFNTIVADFKMWSGLCVCVGAEVRTTFRSCFKSRCLAFAEPCCPLSSGFWEIIYMLLWTPFSKRLHEKNLPLVTPARRPSVWCFVFPDVFGFCLNVLVNTFQGLNSIPS